MSTAVGRPRQFDDARVLQQAMMLFWEKGYEAVSVRDLEQATGLKTSSLYNRFHSRDALFVAVLQFYRERVIGARIARHLQPSQGLAGIHEFLRSTYRQPGPYHACLLANSWSEVSAEFVQARDVMRSGIREVRKALLQQLRTCRQQGELPADARCRVLADYLLMSLQGILLTARFETNKNRLDRMVECIMTSLPLIHLQREKNI